jgi:hypothetical protein
LLTVEFFRQSRGEASGIFATYPLRTMDTMSIVEIRRELGPKISRCATVVLFAQNAHSRRGKATRIKRSLHEREASLWLGLSPATARDRERVTEHLLRLAFAAAQSNPS